MAEYFDRTVWSETVRQDDWYVRLYPELQEMSKRWQAVPRDERTIAEKTAVRGFFAEAYENETLALGSSGPDLDTARLPIDTVVIHHTSSEPGYTLRRMNATQLLNVYVPYFNNPTPDEAELKGMPMWSNHVRDGRPVFYVYHWLMRMDGSFKRLLADDELGWHAANWDINRRSVAICLDNNYETTDPSPDIIQKLGSFIAEHYPQVDHEHIKGHGEVSRTGTLCPGSNFTTGWKRQLLTAVTPV